VANRQDPFDPEIHAGLAKALEATGDRAARRGARFAQISRGSRDARLTSSPFDGSERIREDPRTS
jgi:hypothetical protein